MLKAIRCSGAPCPEVFGSADDLVVMEVVSSDGALCRSAWASPATSISMLHKIAATNYGWPIDHASGAVAISNDSCDSWPIFWADRRLRCHLSSLGPALAERVERVAETIDEHLPAHPKPSTLHGDLCAGLVIRELAWPPVQTRCIQHRRYECRHSGTASFALPIPNRTGLPQHKTMRTNRRIFAKVAPGPAFMRLRPPPVRC